MTASRSLLLTDVQILQVAIGGAVHSNNSSHVEYLNLLSSARGQAHPIPHGRPSSARVNQSQELG